MQEHLSHNSGNTCPVCGNEIPTEAMNVSEGVALCPSCERVSPLSHVGRLVRPITEILRHPPSRCEVRQNGPEVAFTASTRSQGKFLITLGLMLFWNGMLSVFLTLLASAIYANLVGPPPPWMPKPVMNDEPMGPGATIFLAVFLTPFIAAGIVLFWLVAMYVWGRSEVVINGPEAWVQTGIGPLVWRRRFRPESVANVRLRPTDMEVNGENVDVVQIDADRTVRLGALLSQPRREWLYAVIHEWFLGLQPKDREQFVAQQAGLKLPP